MSFKYSHNPKSGLTQKIQYKLGNYKTKEEGKKEPIKKEKFKNSMQGNDRLSLFEIPCLGTLKIEQAHFCPVYIYFFSDSSSAFSKLMFHTFLSKGWVSPPNPSHFLLLNSLCREIWLNSLNRLKFQGGRNRMTMFLSRLQESKTVVVRKFHRKAVL